MASSSIEEAEDLENTASSRSRTWLVAWATKMAPMRAMPSAVPTWRTMPDAPLAEPAFWGGMSLSTTLVSWLVANPMPMPWSNRPGSSCQNVVWAENAKK